MNSSSTWLDLQSRLCVVTGAASGIGAEIALSLAQVGAKVGLLDINNKGLMAACATIRQAVPEAVLFAHECDVGNEASVAVATTALCEALGTPWGLVNNAGYLRPGSLADISVADWNATLAVNLTGYLLMARSLAKRMRESEQGGAIVNIASISANFPQTNSGAYSSSKAAILQLSRQMAVEWGANLHHISNTKAAPVVRSNVICPGMIRTALSAAFYQVPGVLEKRQAMTANGQIGQPSDIANAALFLLSPKSSYVNGAELAVDGGLSSFLMDAVPRPGYNV